MHKENQINDLVFSLTTFCCKKRPFYFEFSSQLSSEWILQNLISSLGNWAFIPLINCRHRFKRTKTILSFSLLDVKTLMNQNNMIWVAIIWVMSESCLIIRRRHHTLIEVKEWCKKIALAVVSLRLSIYATTTTLVSDAKNWIPMTCKQGNNKDTLQDTLKPLQENKRKRNTA